MERESWAFALLCGEWPRAPAQAQVRVKALVLAWVKALVLAWALARVLAWVAFVACAGVGAHDASVVSVAPCS